MNSDSPFFESNHAIAVQQMRAEAAFKNIRNLLAVDGIDILLLKGPHLGHTVYNRPGDRVYGDLDILVRPKDFDLAAAVLRRNAYQPCAYGTFSPEVQRDFKHWAFRSPWGIPVELHRWLSGHDRYPVESDDLFGRAEKFLFNEAEALGLAVEDLLLHLCLHMGTSYFVVIERKHVTDIGLLVQKRPVDWSVFLRRVTDAGAKAIAYYALMAAQVQEAAEIPPHVLERLRPRFFRLWWLEKHIDPRIFPMYRFPHHSIQQIKKRLLLPLLDRPGQRAGFFWRMGVIKMRMVFRIIKGKAVQMVQGGR